MSTVGRKMTRVDDGAGNRAVGDMEIFGFVGKWLEDTSNSRVDVVFYLDDFDALILFV